MTDDLLKHTFLPSRHSAVHLEYSELGGDNDDDDSKDLVSGFCRCQDVVVVVPVSLDGALVSGLQILLTHRADDVVNHPLSVCRCLSSRKESANKAENEASGEDM